MIRKHFDVLWTPWRVESSTIPASLKYVLLGLRFAMYSATMGRILSPFAMQIYGNIDVWLVIGFVFGLVLFIRGLRTFRRGLVVADTPIIPIRSVAMGLAQIHGHAGGGNPFPSPVSGTPCYAFRVVIERYVGRNGWQHHRTDQNGTHFFLVDDSGRIHIDPLKAQFDLPVNSRRSIGDAPVDFSLLGMVRSMSNSGAVYDGSAASADAKTDDELLEYSGLEYGYSQPVRFTEYCIEPDQEYDVLGTCVENPRPEGDDDRNLITKGDHNGTFLISSKSAEQLKEGAGWRSSIMVFGGAALAVFCAALFMAKHGLI